MDYRFYQLVAWTQGEHVKFAPSIFEEASRPYLNKIASLSEPFQDRSDEVARQLALSRAREQFGDFLRRCDKPKEAFAQYAEAARCCLSRTDSRRSDRSRDLSVNRQLRNRFFAMYDTCRAMAKRYPYLNAELKATGVHSDYLSVTDSDRQTAAEHRDAAEWQRASRLGKGV